MSPVKPSQYNKRPLLMSSSLARVKRHKTEDTESPDQQPIALAYRGSIGTVNFRIGPPMTRLSHNETQQLAILLKAIDGRATISEPHVDPSSQVKTITTTTDEALFGPKTMRVTLTINSKSDLESLRAEPITPDTTTHTHNRSANFSVQFNPSPSLDNMPVEIMHNILDDIPVHIGPNAKNGSLLLTSKSLHENSLYKIQEKQKIHALLKRLMRLDNQFKHIPSDLTIFSQTKREGIILAHVDEIIERLKDKQPPLKNSIQRKLLALLAKCIKLPKLSVNTIKKLSNKLLSELESHGRIETEVKDQNDLASISPRPFLFKDETYIAELILQLTISLHALTHANQPATEYFDRLYAIIDSVQSTEVKNTLVSFSADNKYNSETSNLNTPSIFSTLITWCYCIPRENSAEPENTAIRKLSELLSFIEKNQSVLSDHSKSLILQHTIDLELVYTLPDQLSERYQSFCRISKSITNDIDKSNILTDLTEYWLHDQDNISHQLDINCRNQLFELIDSLNSPAEKGRCLVKNKFFETMFSAPGNSSQLFESSLKLAQDSLIHLSDNDLINHVIIPLSTHIPLSNTVNTINHIHQLCDLVESIENLSVRTSAVMSLAYGVSGFDNNFETVNAELNSQVKGACSERMCDLFNTVWRAENTSPGNLTLLVLHTELLSEWLSHHPGKSGVERAERLLQPYYDIPAHPKDMIRPLAITKASTLISASDDPDKVRAWLEKITTSIIQTVPQEQEFQNYINHLKLLSSKPDRWQSAETRQALKAMQPRESFRKKLEIVAESTKKYNNPSTHVDNTRLTEITEMQLIALYLADIVAIQNRVNHAQ